MTGDRMFPGPGSEATEERFAKLIQVHRATSEINESLLQARTVAELLEDACRILVKHCGFDTASVRLLDEESGMLALAATAGPLEQWVREHATDMAAYSVRGSGLAVETFRTGKPCVTNDRATDARFARQHGTATRAGLRSSAGLPLSRSGKASGVLLVASRKQDVFNDDLVDLLGHVAANLSFSIEKFAQEAAARRDEEALRRFRAALDQSSDLVVLSEAESARILDFNDAVCKELGYDRDELLGKTIDALLANRTLGDVHHQRRRAAIHLPGQRDQLRSTWRRKDGSVIEVEIHRQCIDSPDGPIVVGIGRDLTERLAAECRMAEHTRHQQSIAQFGWQALAETDVDRLLENAASSTQAGLDAGQTLICALEASQQRLRVLACAGAPAPSDALDLTAGMTEALASLESGSVFQGPAARQFSEQWRMQCASVLIQPVRETRGRRLFIVGLSRTQGAFSDAEAGFLEAVSSLLSTAMQRHDSEARLAYLAQYDTLTGLANRTVLRDALATAISQARRHKWAVGVLFVDLDRFKLINDTLGHMAGDRLLAEASARLTRCVRGGDIVGRISGDEFAIVLSCLTHSDDAALVGRKVLDALAAPFQLGGEEAFVSGSIGIALFPADSDNAETLLKQADTAMYRAKESGRNGFCFYTAEMNQRSQRRLQLANELRRALDREEFRLHYHPKISLADGSLCGLEALLRWQHPERGLVGPQDFIPVLEETGLIMPVGDWALAEACRQVRRWQDEGFQPVPVAVNVSARQFREKRLDRLIQDCAAQAGIETQLIELEITESHLIENPAAARAMLQVLRDAGVRISVDDFGTGYSSLSYLTQLPLTALKIDRSFVRHATTRTEAASIVRAIITMAQSLRFITIAEGVETQEQAEFLRALGCDQAQGFYFSQPLEARDIALRLRKRDPAGAGG